jgi:outer membrane protein TolC
MYTKFLCTAMAVISLCATGSAQTRQRSELTIQDVLRLVDENNLTVAASRVGVRVSDQSVVVANSARLPEISASVDANFLGDVTIMDRYFKDVTRAPMPHFGNSLGVSLYQPVYAGGAITAGVNLAKAENQLARTTLEQTRQSVGMDAVSCYLELFKARNLLEIYDENIATTKRVIEQMESRHEAGVVLKNDITRFELRLSTLTYDRLTISDRIGVLNHDLTILTGLADGTEVIPQIGDELESLPPIESRESWMNATLANSQSLKLLDNQSDINEQQLKLLKAERLPQIGIVAGDSFSGPITFEIPVINKNYNYWFVGLNVKYNISSLFKSNKKIVKNTLEREQISANRRALENSLDRTIDHTYTQYTLAFQMLSTEEKNLELATQNYSVVENRYNNQLALLTDLLDASTAKLDAEVRLVNARVNIIYYYYQLKFNSGTL